MGSIPLPALDVKAPQQASPIEQFAQVQQLQNLMQQGKAGQQAIQENNLKLQQQQNQLKDQQAMTSAMQQWDGKDYNSLIPLVIKNGGTANAVIGLKQHALETQKTYSQMAKDDSETGKNNIETTLKKNDIVAGQLATAMQAPDDQLPQAVMQVATGLAQNGLIDQQHLQMAQGLSQSGNPQQIRQALDMFRKGYLADSQLAAEAKAKADAQKAADEHTAAGTTQMQQGQQLIAQQMGMAQSQDDWNARKEFLQKKGLDVSQVPAQFTPENVALIKKSGLNPVQSAELDKTNQEIANFGKPTDKDRYVQAQENYRATLARQSSTSNELQKQGIASLQKQSDTYTQFLGTANSLKNSLEAAQNGNQLAAAVAPLQGTLFITTSEGVKRINETELRGVSGAGSLVQRIEGALGKTAGDGPLSAQLKQDMGKLVDLYTAAKYDSYKKQAAYTQKLHGLDSSKTPILTQNGDIAGDQQPSGNQGGAFNWSSHPVVK